MVQNESNGEKQGGKQAGGGDQRQVVGRGARLGSPAHLVLDHDRTLEADGPADGGQPVQRDVGPRVAVRMVY